jgi:hypothetical protein
MSRFYFDVQNGFGFVEDEEGRELESIEEAKVAAIEGVRSIMAAEVVEGRLDLRGEIHVLNAERKLIMTIKFSDTIDIQTGELPAQATEGRRP